MTELKNIFDSHSVEQYTKYISYKNFEINSNVVKVFEYMGIINTNNYPLDYWKCKLQDNRIRERFNKDRLYSDPMFGLHDITHLLKNDLLPHLKVIANTLCDGCYLTGGALSNLFIRYKRYRILDSITEFEKAYNILKKNYNVSDLDIFMTKDIDIVSELDKLLGLLNVKGEKKVKYRKTEFSISSMVYINYVISYTTQFILRRYRSTNEMVYGFDIDASGLILIDGRVYATHCAKYAIVNREIYFDPERSSPSYTKRLIKYGKKGYNVKVPQIDWNKVDCNTMGKLRSNFFSLSHFAFPLSYVLKMKSFPILLIYLYFKEDYSSFTFNPTSNYSVDGKSYQYENSKYSGIEINVVNTIVTVKSQNKKEKLSSCINWMSDKHKEIMQYEVKDTDPMSQITGSFIPEVTSFKDYSNVDYIYGDGSKEIVNYDVYEIKNGTYHFDFIESELKFTYKYGDINIKYRDRKYKKNAESKYFTLIKGY